MIATLCILLLTIRMSNISYDNKLMPSLGQICVNDPNIFDITTFYRVVLNSWSFNMIATS